MAVAKNLPFCSAVRAGLKPLGPAGRRLVAPRGSLGECGAHAAQCFGISREHVFVLLENGAFSEDPGANLYGLGHLRAGGHQRSGTTRRSRRGRRARPGAARRAGRNVAQRLNPQARAWAGRQYRHCLARASWVPGRNDGGVHERSTDRHGWRAQEAGRRITGSGLRRLWK